MRDSKKHIDVRAVHVERCLHAQHQKASCGHCKRVCSSSAISLANNLPTVQPLLCKGCGTCIAACPMEVFQAQNWSPEWLIRSLRERQNESHCLTCLNAANAPTDSLRTRACLAAYSPATWLQACWNTTIHLDLSACTKCKIQHGRAIIEHAIGTCNAWLEECKRPYRIEAHDHNAISMPNRGFARKNLLDGNEASREFEAGFSLDGSLLFGQEKPADARRGATNRPSTKAPKKQEAVIRRRLDHVHLPLPQQQLQSLWASENANAANTEQKSITLPNLSMNPSLCKTCGTCFQYCPTGAIQHVVEERSEASQRTKSGSSNGSQKQFAFSFQPGRCADCGLCILSCSEGALSRNYQRNSPLASVVVMSVAVKPCVECGQITLQNGPDTCIWCRKQKNTDPIIASARCFHKQPSREDG